jgi:polyhydroxyalkanoate synthase
LTAAETSVEALARSAADATQADNPFVLIDYRDLARAIARWCVALAVRHPGALAAELARALVALAKVAAGTSDARPSQSDRRFVDDAWEAGLHRRLMQAYLVCRATTHGLVDRAEMGHLATERARFGLTLVTEALAPTNFLLTNPTALGRARESRGASLVRGARNALTDLLTNGGMPAQVDPRPFVVGENVAATPGAVVHRTEVFELIQYTPTTPQITGTPLLVVPSQVNKYYFADLSPGRSLVEFTTNEGMPTYAISWRNPDKRHADWGFETYLAAVKEATDVALAVSRSATVHLAGICGGGIMVSMLLAHLIADGDPRGASATLMVTHLDQEVESISRMFVGDPVVAAAKRRSARKGILEGRDTARFFAWLRPNELVWAYYVNNWLLGEDPPSHELLFWNVDNTRLPARLHADYLDLYLDNPLAHANAIEILGTPIDLGAITVDSYVVGGTTDHVTPWKGCYRSACVLGGQSEFVLSVSGHVGTVVAAPGDPRARYLAAPVEGSDADAWLSAAEEREGSWWPHWVAWLRDRSEPSRRARAAGSRAHPVSGAAPGEYVL